MDALAAVGLVGNILTFLDFGIKIVGAVKEVKSSGSTKKIAELETLGKRIKEQATNITQKKFTAPADVFEIGLIERANECIQLSTELHELIQKTKSAKPGSMRESIKVIYRTYKKKDKKDELERKLRGCKDQLQLQLITVEGSRVMRCLDEIIVSGASRDQDIHQLVTDIDMLTAGIKAIDLASGAMEQVSSLLRRSEQAIDTTLQHKILKELATDKLTDRFDNVEQAHMDTFSWLLEIEEDNGDSTDEAASQYSTEDSDPGSTSEFSEAHNSGDHNSSSDLSAEFNDNDDKRLDDIQLQAKRDLTNWLLTGQGIFHISGQPGAGKSTLMKFLCRSPATKKYLQLWASGKHLVIANFFFWKLGTETQRSVRGLRRGLLHSALSQDSGLLKSLFAKQGQSIREHGVFHLDNEDIENAFDILVNAEATLASYRFAIFIDGLDELEGDHGKIVQQLFKWTSSNPTDLKICVSSREWLIFMERFSSCPKLQLHRITYGDIKKFVHDELAETDEFRASIHRDELIDLANQVVERAQGVFLWSKIALRNLQNGLLVDDGIDRLKKIIYELPGELNDLYFAIFHSIMNLSLPSDRIKAMKTISIVLEKEEHLSALQLSFLDDYDDDMDFAFKMTVRHGSCKELAKRSKLAQNLIRHWCMGLLEFGTSSTEPMLKSSHLSVKEFFSQGQIRRTITSLIGDFDPLDFDIQSYLAVLKTRKPRQKDLESYAFQLGIESRIGNHARLWPSYGCRISKFLDTIIDALEKHGISKIDYTKFASSYCGREPCQWSALLSPKDLIQRIAIQLGMYRYFLQEDETMTPGSNEYKEGKLLHATLNAVMDEGREMPATVHVRESVSTATLLVFAHCLEHYTSPNVAGFCEHISIWQHCIADSVLADRPIQYLEPIFRLLLLHGADPNVWLELKSHERSSDLLPRPYHDYMLVLQAGGEEQGFRVGRWVADVAGERNQFLEQCRKSGGAILLRDLVEIWFPDNAKVLQHLIDRNLGRPGPLTSRTLSDLKADPQLDLDANKGLSYKPTVKPLISTLTQS